MKQGLVIGLIGLVVLCLGGAAWLALQPSGAAPDAVVLGEAERGEAVEAEGSGMADALSIVAPEARVAAGEASPNVEAVPAPPAVDADPEGEPVLVLAGRFVLYENGLPVDVALNGTVPLTAWGLEGGLWVTVPVVNSHFEVEMTSGKAGVRLLSGKEVLRELKEELKYFTMEAPEADGFEGLQLRSDDSPESILRNLRLEVGPMITTVGLRRTGAVTLDVVAAGTGAHLMEVDVYYVNDYSSMATFPLGQPTLELAQAESSPVTLERVGKAIFDKEAVLIVGAPGYAWKRMTLDLTHAGNRLVELLPAGSLRVDYVGFTPRRAQLRLYTEDTGRSPYADLRLRDQTTTLAGLAPGIYRVSVEVGKWSRNPAVLGEQEVTVVAGRESAVRLAVKAQPMPTKAPFSGTLILSGGWDLADQYVSLERISPSSTGVISTASFKGSELPPVPGEDGHFAFEVPALEPGTYSITYFPLLWTKILEHPPEGTRDYVLEVPAPRDVTVRVVLAGTDEPIEEVESFLWYPSRPKGATISGVSAVGRNGETGAFHLKTPPSSFRVITIQAGYVNDNVEFDASTGTEFVLELRKSSVCKIELRSGEAVIPWPEKGQLELADPEGDLSTVYLGSSGAEKWFEVGAAGSYSIQVPEVEGFLPHAPVTVDLVLGEEQTVVIELTPR